MYLRNWLTHSSTYMYMKKVNDVKLLTTLSILSGPLDFEIKRVAWSRLTVPKSNRISHIEDKL